MRIELQHLMGDQVRLFPAASGDSLKAGFAADEGLNRFRCIYGLRTQPPDSRQAESILMQRHVPSRSEAICRYADGLVRANIDAYGCDERVRGQQS